ncbi:hypothetical protein LCGC14_0570260 [marine sediment metagenome]|uniref:Nuclease associated modular domain-containing protein n=1 Tax=marine sediment metagenome TaxID=412755 RepID=A0A0F9RPG7_9ZZZZ|nr:hypothetical protein [Pricia sp.]
MQNINPKNKLCECGCGGFVTKPGNRFIHGHHRRGVKVSKETTEKRVESNKKYYKTNSHSKKGTMLVNGKFVKKEDVEFPLCKCKCGERVKNIKNLYIRGHNPGPFKSGHTAWNKGLTKETSKSLADGGKKQSATKAEIWPKEELSPPQLCKCKCGGMTNPGREFIIHHNLKLVERTPEIYEKVVKKTKGQKRPNGNWNPWSKGLTKETDHRLKLLGDKVSIAMTAKFKNDPVFTKEFGRIRGLKPNKLELKFEDFLNELFPNEYKYVGDFDTFIGGKCPDFMNVNGQKKLIEVYGDYWHRNDDPQDRIDHFKKYGFDCLVIWESEYQNNLMETKDKVIRFHN